MGRREVVGKALVVCGNPFIAVSGRWGVVVEALVGHWGGVGDMEKVEANYLSFG